MVLIADSGSSKCDWALCNNGSIIESFTTVGLNPLHISQENFSAVINQLPFNQMNISSVFFYGSGCGTQVNINFVQENLKNYFKEAAIHVNNDLLGAARSLGQKQDCCVGILGTGSHAGLYNGDAITAIAPNLGYILGDEGSGVWIGKQLIRNYFYNVMPAELKRGFYSTYHIERYDFINEVYKLHKGASYFSKFASFAIEHKTDEFMKRIIMDGFSQFIENQLLALHLNNLPIHFTGSISYLLKSELIEALELKHLKAGHIISKPIEGLVIFHHS